MSEATPPILTAAAPRPGQIVFARPNSYCTAAGTHGGYPAVDAFAARGTPLYAPGNGRSESAWYSKGGNACWFYTDPGQGLPNVYYLAHGAVPFRSGRVRQGEQIGQVGDTGNATGNPHVHFAAAASAAILSARDGSGSVWFEPWVWGQGAAPTPTPPAPTKPRFRVKVDGLRVRKSPGTDTEVLEELSAGAIFTATVPDSHAWRKGKTASGKIGWVANEHLEELP